MKTLTIRNITFNEGKIKICHPIVGRTKEEILAQAFEVRVYQPDVVEFRADYYEDLENTGRLFDVLTSLRAILKDMVLLFTIRTSREGGEKTLDFETYQRLNIEAAKSGMVDLVDVEMFFLSDEQGGVDAINASDLEVYQNPQMTELITQLKKYAVHVIGSNHDFDKTPEKTHMQARLMAMANLGADIAKLAVMPQIEQDVLDLLQATLYMKQQECLPVITMSMGELGKTSRICGAHFGNSMTFACARNASAPGQVFIENLRGVL